MVTLKYRPILDADYRAAKNKLTDPIDSIDDLSKVVSSIKLKQQSYSISLKTIRNLQDKTPLSTELFNFAMRMYQSYEDAINIATTDCINRQASVTYQKTLFLTTEVYDQLENVNITAIKLELTDCYSCIIPFQVSLKIWAALIIDFRAKTIFYVDPTIDNDHIIAPNLQANLDRYQLNINKKILKHNKIVTETESWICTIYPNVKRLHQKPQNLNDYGVFLISAIPFIAQSCPVIFSSGDLREFRICLCNELLHQSCN